MVFLRSYKTLILTFFAISIAEPGTATVPITIAPTGHAMVPVTGPFGEELFVFDTGAEGTALYADFADDAALPSAGRETLQGQTGMSELPLLQISSLTVDGQTVGPLAAMRFDRRADNVRLPGVVGLDMFGHLAVDFNLPAKQLTLMPTGTPPVGLTAAPVIATPTLGNLLTIPVPIGKTIAIAVIDTGARKTRINWKLAHQLGLEPSKLTKGDPIQGATNNEVSTASGEITDVILGNRHLARAPVLVADLPVFDAFGVADRPAIILGLDWLETTRMVVDFPARRVWFQASD